MACPLSTSGGKHGKRLETDTKTALYNKAKRYQIKGRSLMTKSQLVEAVRAKQREFAQRFRKQH